MGRRLHILMLVGATTTPDMAELSELYARGCESALGGLHDFTVLHRAPEGGWRTGRSVDAAKQGAARTLSGALAALEDLHFDIGLPQMFCLDGMTDGRALFGLLSVPMLGNSPLVMGLGADKALARAVVAQAGVNVPDGVVVPLGSRPSEPLIYPVIVKPARSDNSEGLNLVRSPADLPAALAAAHRHGDALIERFIPPGRELRCGVIEWRGELRALPPEEYPVGKNHPVRTKADKLARGDGALRLVAKSAEAAWIVAPGDPVVPALQAAALSAYRALGCRDYGLFDFRVDDDGVPWFLEAGLYCSFSPDSVICAMARADGIDLPALFGGLAGARLAMTPRSHAASPFAA